MNTETTTATIHHSDLACDTCGRTIYWCNGHRAPVALTAAQVALLAKVGAL